LANHLGDELDIYIICKDRDFGDTVPYPDLPTGVWVQRGKARVMYLPPRRLSFHRYRVLLRGVVPDTIYLNTVFSVNELVFPTIAALLYRRRKPMRIVVAPRGCLDPGARTLKGWKKRPFLFLLRLSGLPRRVIWQASTEAEARYTRDSLGPVNVVVASNLPSKLPLQLQDQPKKPGTVKLIFLSRVTRKKNLSFLIDRLASVSGEIHLTIAGPVEDETEWERCQKRLLELPHVRVSQVGTLTHEQVPEVLAGHHFFVLPTLGENFGHAILEAFDSGLGVLVSDRTPWRNLERLGAGWDIPLEDPVMWEARLQACCDMDDNIYKTVSSAAKMIRSHALDLHSIRRANLELLRGINKSGL
jgi:glycosyltransferase involved in cell wall biosynthesis